MEPQTSGSGATPRDAAAAALTSDPLTAELLRKHAAGEKLTAAEYGKIGAHKAGFLKRTMGIFTGKGGTPGAAAGPSTGPAGNAPGVAAMAPGQAPADRMEPVPIDAALAKRTAGALLNRLEAAQGEWLASEGRKAGAVAATLDRLRSSACLAPADRKLLEELSPDVMAELGFNPRQFAVWIAAAVIGGSAWNTWLAVDEIRELRKEKAPEPNSPKAAALKASQDTTKAVGNPLDAERKSDMAALRKGAT